MHSIKVEQVMTKNPITVAPSVTVVETAKKMIESDIGGLPVVGDDGGLLGIVTESDLIVHDSDVKFPSFVHFLAGYVFVPGSLKKFDEKFRRAVGNTAGDVMTKDVVTVDASETVEDVATKMSENKMKRFPVVKEGELVGIITMKDIVRLISRDIPVVSED
ncbi:MAG: CBS domain-containing protein [Actinobacteria bacterium]|nr:CBS domain-containing protein [Actinomycetota bacterium]